MFGHFRKLMQPQSPPKEPPPGKHQAGYLWGSGEPIDIIGDVHSWHLRASQGKAIAFWSLYYGNREIGLSIYPTNEVKDWPDMLNQMLLGLEGLADCPLDDDELDEIRHSAEEAAEHTKGFAWLPENRKPQNPYPQGTYQWRVWDYTFKNAVAKKYGSEFLRRGRQ